MPLFFFCSGMLAHWGLDRDWGRVLRGRVWVMVWIYLVWSTLTIAIGQIYPIMPWTDRPQSFSTFLWLSYSSQWFIYALVCATLFARAVFYLGVVWQIALTLLAQVTLHLWSPEFEGLTTNFDHLVSTLASHGLLFFMAGIWLARFLLPLLANRRHTVWLFTVGFVLWIAIYATHAATPVSVPRAVHAAPGVLAGLALASLLSLVPVIRAPMQWVGRRTLEIFVCHQFVVGLATLFCELHGVGPSAAFLVISGVTVASAISFARMTESGRPRLLYRPPTFGRKRRGSAVS